MYNHLLDTFKIVAEAHSFTKAAEKLFLTHTAVRKQINHLESIIGVPLFVRKKTGVTLTAAGRVLYAGSLQLMKESSDLMRKVREASPAGLHTLRVGSSNLYPCYIFMDLWDKISRQLPNWRLKVVNIENDKKRLEDLGRDYDFVVGAYDSFSESSPYEFKAIGVYHFTIAVPRSNPLASAKSLRLADLKGQPLLMMKKGTSPLNDAIREELSIQYPEVNLVDIEPHYNLQTFNLAVETGSPLLSLECWDRVHPELKSIPLQEHYALPYGMIFLKKSKLMQDYVTHVAEVLADKH